MGLILRVLISSFFIIILFLTFSQDQIPVNNNNSELIQKYRKAEKFYHHAEKTSDETEQDSFNKKALKGFQQLLPGLNLAKNDSISFYTYFKIGVLQHFFGNFSEANKAYNQSIRLKENLSEFKDSLFFKPFLYSGIIYYTGSQFDSALIRYKEAESIADHYLYKLSEVERLFNNLGVLYFETGNYKQAKNYFEKAISTLTSSNPYYENLLVNYRINLAQVLTKLEDYRSAILIYENVLSFNVNKSEIYHNIGVINLNLSDPVTALTYFRKVQYPPNDNKTIRLYSDIGNAFFLLKQIDSAVIYLQNANKINSRLNGAKKNTAHGLTLKYSGDISCGAGNYKEALKQYQQAIIQFDNDFNDQAIQSNPQSFSGIFSYINLFNTLNSKASALEQQYKNEKIKDQLYTALNTYQSAFKLVDYVEKSYESDEARLFLNKIKYIVHARPIDLCIELYELTKEIKYLEEAYLFDQRNKASVLSLSLQENIMQQQSGIPVELSRQISSVKSSITQLSLKAAKISDSIQLELINNTIRDYEIQLSKLQEQINSNANYARLQPADRIPSVSYIQKELLDNRTALISFQLSENELLIFYITNDKFDYIKKRIDSSFFNYINSFVKSLHSVNTEQNYSGEKVAEILHSLLLKPILSKLPNIQRLLIIPDDELNYLPFEALQDEKKQFLLQNFSVQYQYSTALLKKNDAIKLRKSETLAMAPFTHPGISDSFSELTYSEQEINGLIGKILFGKDATKNNFIQLANQYNIIQLATHASADDVNPLNSFIVFYPDEKDSVENFKLYAREIYDLKLDLTQLIILSACETGAGKLVKGEGLMSLSRAFAYAGCPNIITSLWKAEDKTTAFITKRLHHYLENNYSKDVALQKAKLDLLNSDEIDPLLKRPNYWAHLVFIGNYEGGKSRSYCWWIVGTIIIILALFIWLKKKSRK